jgi:head-tail adaptor
VFQVKTIPEVQDPYGGPQEVWAIAFAAWCAFEPLGGREFQATMKISAEATARFRVRFRGVFQASTAVDTYRILFNARTWNILSINPGDDPRDELLMEASEVDTPPV